MSKISTAVRCVLDEPSYREASKRIGRDIARTGGVDDVRRVVLELVSAVPDVVTRSPRNP